MLLFCVWVWSLFIHARLLAFLPDFLFTEMELFWAWRKWSSNINLLSSALLPSRAFFHGILPIRSLKRPKSAFLKSRVMILLFPPLSHGHCNQDCLWPSYPQWALHCWWIWGLVEHLSSLAHLSPGLLMPCFVVPLAGIRLVEVCHENKSLQMWASVVYRALSTCFS